MIALLELIVHLIVVALVGYAIYSVYKTAQNASKRQRSTQRGHSRERRAPDITGKSAFSRASKPWRSLSNYTLAKESLQVLVAHDRAQRTRPSYLPKIQREILDIIRKYVEVDMNAVSVNFEQEDGTKILELNIVLPEHSSLTETTNKSPKDNEIEIKKKV